MFNRLANWLDDRTGYRALLHEALEEPIPGGARWRYVFGSALTTTFTVQLVTGILLMFSYSPSSTTAWGSVYYISYQMQGGWFLRGIHHFGSQAMVVLLLLHMLQVLLAGAYRAPREVNWWFGLALMGITLGFSLTGYLLPWDQKGYWATKVATNIAGGTPGIGPYLQKVVVGGGEYGNQTLTRFYGLHVGLLPGLLVVCLAAHIALFRRHGLTPPKETRGIEGKFWPEQVFMDMIASIAVFGVLVGLVFYEGGANLDAPADPSGSDYPARPEWYFLSLFQLLKKFPGKYEYIGTFVIPTALMVVLVALPLLDKLIRRKAAHFIACGLVFALVGGGGYLTFEAMRDDARDPAFQEARVKADVARNRALQLALDPGHGIPPSGASALLQTDPLTHGRQVLEAKCLSCHYFDGEGQVSRARYDMDLADWNKGVEPPINLPGLPPKPAHALGVKLKGFAPSSVSPNRRGEAVESYSVAGSTTGGEAIEAVVAVDGAWVQTIARSKQTAADLKGFGTRDWIRGLLEDPGSPTYFGNVPQSRGMVRWKKQSKLDAKQLDQVADFFAKHVATIPAGMTPSEWEAQEAVGNHPGYALFAEDCASCHGEDWNRDNEGAEAPGLFGWGSTWWTERMIHDPAAPGLYGYLKPRDRMPGFADQLTDNDTDTLIRFLHGEYLVVPKTAPSQVGR